MVQRSKKSDRKKSVRRSTSVEFPSFIKDPKDRQKYSQRTTKAWAKNLTAQLYLTGNHTSVTISDYFREKFDIKLTHGTIRCYLVQLKREWMENAARDTNTLITEELARLAQIEEYAIGALRDGSLRVADNGTFVQLGDAKDFCEVMLKISKRRSSLMGLDKARKIALVDERTSELSDEELEAIVSGEEAVS